MKKLFTLIVLAISLFSTGKAQTCDTLFNLKSVLDTPFLYYADTGSSPGYISGNNVYGDLIKAEGFASVIGDSVYSAVFYFAVATINANDSNLAVTFAVWDNTGTSGYGIAGAPGNIIDTANVSLRQIAQSLTYSPDSAIFTNYIFYGLLVNFAQPAPLTTDTFYVGVFLPTNLGDTIALWTNEVPPGPDGNGWEFEGAPYDSWGSYNDDWNFTLGSVGNYISVNVCGNAVTGINEPAGNIAVKVFPNPANSQLNFEWNSTDAGEAVMYDVTGSMVKSFNIQGTALNTFDIADLAPGPYIIRVTDKQTNQQSSVLFTKTD